MECKGGLGYARTHVREIGKHLGKWIIIHNDKIFAADDDLEKIYKKFKAENPGEIPCIVSFPKEKYVVL